jgi:hypothetical protein
MKQIFLILLVTSFIQAYSQENDSTIVLQSSVGRLSGLVNIQDLNEDYNSFKFEGHWAGVELGINGFANSGYSMYPTSEQNFLDNDLIRSNSLNLNVLQYSKGIQQTRNNIGLVTGVGLSFQSYHLDNNTTISVDESGKIHPSILYFDSSQKSKLSTLYLDVPLLVEFQIPIGHFANRLYFSAGLTGSKRLETHTKIKYHKNGKREKLKSPGDFAIKDYKVAATFRMGYRWVNVFATCDLAPLFNDRDGPVVYPFSAGIRLISF